MYLIGTYTKRASQGIYQVSEKDTQLYVPQCNPTYLALAGQRMVCVSQSDEGGGLAVYDDKTLLATCYDQVAPPCYVCFLDVDHLVSCNYHDGSLDFSKSVHNP